jgi:hypothetical protein
MNPDTGVIRTIPEGQQPDSGELELTTVEAKVLERYRPDLRAELLRRWRAGAYEVVATTNGPELVLARPESRQRRREQERARQTIEGWKAKKARRHLAAQSRRRNRR